LPRTPKTSLGFDKTSPIVFRTKYQREERNFGYSSNQEIRNQSNFRKI